MNILLLDDDPTVEKFLDYFVQFEKEWSYTTYNTNLSLSTLFTQFNLLVVDNSKENFYTIFQEIIKHNPLVKTIVISDLVKNCNLSGCEQCNLQLKRKRLFKPIGFEEFYHLIKFFDSSPCPFFEAFESIKNIIPSLVKSFSYLEYEQNEEVIIANTQLSNNRYTYEFISMIHILEKNHIPFMIEDEFRIKIL